MKGKLLIVEDDAALNQMLALHFQEQDFQTHAAFTCAEALEQAETLHPDLVLLDQQLPDGLGNTLIPRLLELAPGTCIVMMTGVHDLELAIQAIQDGACDFIHKPVKTELLQQTVEKALASRTSPVSAPEDRPTRARELIGRSDAMLAVSKQIALSAQSNATVLITGESGTGKEVVARLVHQYSGRKGPFVALNCAAIVDTLLESELFGHEKGAFTGAVSRKPGRFQQAQDGTLFLDEIGELAPPLQAKLLRALQEQVVEPVGATEPVPVNCRIIAATHRDLFELSREGRFREDLAYRLEVITIQLPPLRERPEDIPLLVQALLERAARQMDRPVPPLTPEAEQKLLSHQWPGNVRELENVLTLALVEARDGAITTDRIHFRGEIPIGNTPDPGTGETEPLFSLAEMEARHIQRVLEHTGGHKANACRILGISRPALDRKIRKYGLKLP